VDPCCSRRRPADGSVVLVDPPFAQYQRRTRVGGVDDGSRTWTSTVDYSARCNSDSDRAARNARDATSYDARSYNEDLNSVGPAHRQN